MKIIFYLSILTFSLFGSSLNELIEYALKNSTIIKQSKTQERLSNLQREQSKASKYGEFYITGDINHYNSPRTLAPLTPSVMMSASPITTTKTIYSTGLVYSVALFTGFAQTRQVEIDEIAKNVSKIKLRLTKEQLCYNIKSIYLSILSLQELLKAQKEYTKSLFRLKEQIKNEVKLGKKAEIDLLKAKADLQSSKTAQEITISNIQILKANLSSIVGKEIKSIKMLKISIKKPNFSAQNFYNKIPSLSIVTINDMNIKKAAKMIQKSKSAKYPQVTLDSYIGKNYGDDIGINGWDSETLVQTGISIRYSLFDFGKRDINIQKATIQKIKAKLQKEQLLLDIKKRLVEAVAKIDSSYYQYIGYIKQYDLSKKSANIEAVRYENGVSTLNDLLLAKSKSELSFAKIIQAKYQYQKNIYYLNYILERGIK